MWVRVGGGAELFLSEWQACIGPVGPGPGGHTVRKVLAVWRISLHVTDDALAKLYVT